MMVAQIPDDLSDALAIAVCSTSAVCWPMSPLNCAKMAFCAASWPKTSPAIAMTIKRIGAIEVTVKKAIAAPRLRA
jgi:hypothetical protein